MGAQIVQDVYILHMCGLWWQVNKGVSSDSSPVLGLGCEEISDIWKLPFGGCLQSISDIISTLVLKFSNDYIGIIYLEDLGCCIVIVVVVLSFLFVWYHHNYRIFVTKLIKFKKHFEPHNSEVFLRILFT